MGNSDTVFKLFSVRSELKKHEISTTTHLYLIISNTICSQYNIHKKVKLNFSKHDNQVLENLSISPVTIKIKICI